MLLVFCFPSLVNQNDSDLLYIFMGYEMLYLVTWFCHFSNIDSFTIYAKVGKVRSGSCQTTPLGAGQAAAFQYITVVALAMQVGGDIFMQMSYVSDDI